MNQMGFDLKVIFEGLEVKARQRFISSVFIEGQAATEVRRNSLLACKRWVVEKLEQLVKDVHKIFFQR